MTAATPTLHANVPTQIVAVDGTNFAYRSTGAPAEVPVILFNHLAAVLDDWDPRVIDGLAAEHQVITFNNRGVGASAGDTPQTVGEMADDAIAFIRALGYDRVDVLGFSLGGAVSQEVVLRAPDLVRRLILAGIGPAGGLGIDKIPAMAYRAQLRSLLTFGDVRTYLFFTRTKNGQKQAKGFLARVKERTTDRDTSISVKSFRNQLKAITAFAEQPPHDLSVIEQPVLVANGESDRMVPSVNSAHLMLALPNARLVLYTDAGHGGVFQHHHEFVPEVLEFLRDLKGTPMPDPLTPLDPKAVDHALTTTRAVRKRLDLTRPVDPQLILDCIDVAEQAPSGGNIASRRWIVINDDRRKRQLADLYRETGDFILSAQDRLAGTDHPAAKTMASAAYLVEHLAEVPAIVIPTISGRHDNSGRPGLFDSVIQSAWSFCLALRARGLGTTWTTAIFSREDELKEILRIPEDTTEIVMLPIAHTIGTDFALAPRRPARDITYFNTYGHTFDRGPTDPAAFIDGAGGVVEIDVNSTPDRLWQLVTDIDLPARASEELQGAAWIDSDGAALGSRFRGRNHQPDIGEWETDCVVDVFEPNQAFGWSAGLADNPGARWRFELEPIGDATRLRYSMTIGPGPSGLTPALDAMPDKEPRILHRRVSEHRANMQRVIETIKTTAESTD